LYCGENSSIFNFSAKSLRHKEPFDLSVSIATLAFS
jgi:hypothetical protein